jgi:hypothetical protein
MVLPITFILFVDGLLGEKILQPPHRQERASGFEPPTSSLGSWHSATELRPQKFFQVFILQRLPSNCQTYSLRKAAVVLKKTDELIIDIRIAAVV